MPDTVPVVPLLAGADIEEFEAAELDGALIVDAFVVFRYQRPDWSMSRAAFVGTAGMSEELQIGLLTMVLDRLRASAASHWVDDDDE